MPILILYKSPIKLNLRSALMVALGFVVLAFLFSVLFPNAFERLSYLSSISEEKVDITSSESITVRRLIWSQCTELIKNAPVFGTGVGDANDELYAAYAAHGLSGALSHRLNAHNQFFQTFIGLGLVGFTVLFALTFVELIKGFMRKNFLLFIFSLVIILNFMVESMLQTSAGVLFFTFFLCLFNLTNEQQLAGD